MTASGRDPERAEELDEGEPHRPVLRVDADRRSRSGVRLGSRLDRRPLEGGERVVAAPTLTSPQRISASTMSAVKSRRPRLRTRGGRVIGRVMGFAMEPGRGHNVEPGRLRNRSEPGQVPPRPIGVQSTSACAPAARSDAASSVAFSTSANSSPGWSGVTRKRCSWASHAPSCPAAMSPLTVRTTRSVTPLRLSRP